MGLGKLFYLLIYKPTHNLRYNLTHFGLKGWINLRRYENSMRVLAKKENPITISTDQSAIEISYLTGEKYWHQTLYGIKSLNKYLKGDFRVRIYSDGSLSDKLISILQRFCPQIQFINEEAVIDYLDEYLPASKYPSLRFLRDWHPFFRRLIDIHTSKAWGIHLDSDMLFFNTPLEIIDAHKKGTAIYMKELLQQSFYVDNIDTLNHKYGINCTPLVNGGLIAYNGKDVDYEDLEVKATTLLENYKHSGPARIEQTLTAYILNNQNATGLNADKYHIFYDKGIPCNTDQILRHYIFKAKLPYFKSEWKNIIR
jgi:hypothetical protein